MKRIIKLANEIKVFFVVVVAFYFLCFSNLIGTAAMFENKKFSVFQA